jgi:hypothetical protein
MSALDLRPRPVLRALPGVAARRRVDAGVPAGPAGHSFAGTAGALAARRRARGTIEAASTSGGRGLSRVTPLAERFAAKVDRHGPIPKHRPSLGRCHVWTGASASGYGKIRGEPPESRRRQAHVVGWELHYDRPFPKNRESDHLCRNTLCVRWSHIEPVTRLENARRTLDLKRTRTTFICGHSRRGWNLCRSRRSRGNSPTDRCRTCWNAYQRKRSHEKKLSSVSMVC